MNTIPTDLATATEPREVPEPFQKALIDATNNGEYAAFVVWLDKSTGITRLESCHCFTHHAKTQFETVREMISAKVQEFLTRLTRGASAALPHRPAAGPGGMMDPGATGGLGGFGGLAGIPMPPGTRIGPEVAQSIKIGVSATASPDMGGPPAEK